MLKKITALFSSTLNLIRAELFFGACFAQFYSLLFSELGDIKYSQAIVNIYTVVFVIILVITYLRPNYLKQYRIISNSMYLLASIYILFIAYMNNYDKVAFFLVIFNYVFISFSMPNLKVLGVLNVIFYWMFIMSYVFLNYEPETPFWVAFGSLLFISTASFFIVIARNVYKDRIKNKQLLLNHIFNGSNDGLLLLCKDTYVVEDCNTVAEEILGINKEDMMGQGLLNLELKGRALFEHLDIYNNETIELDSKEIIHYQKKNINYPSYAYMLVQVKLFKNKAHMKDIFKLSWRRLKPAD